MNAGNGLFAELQRRSVFKVGAAYLVVAWLAAQAAGLAFPTFEAPVWALRVFIFVLALGFPIALVLAWVLDATPEGIKVDPTSTGNTRMLAIAGVIVVVVIGWYWVGTVEQTSPYAATATAPGAATASANDDRSIAVLPFTNLSGDPGYEYFSDGVSEEILNVLAKIPELRVAARTSSFSFKDEKREIPDIARELQVRMVLEGSVRKQGDRVRITAQLIDASNGFHVWSQNYDRESKDIFAIQDEIAQAIARELKVTLGAASSEGAENFTGTTDLAAYDDYLKGLALWQTRDPGKLREAIRLFSSAIERDPGFARAWAGIALAHAVLPGYDEVDDDANAAALRRAASRALALDPRSAEAVTALALNALNLSRDSKTSHIEAVALARYALALNPSYASAHQVLGNSLAYQGDAQAAVEALRTAAGLDPRAPAIAGNHAVALFGADMQEEAFVECARVRSFSSLRNIGCGNLELLVALNRGDKAAARAALMSLAEIRGKPEDRALVERVADAIDGKRAARPIVEELAAFAIPIRLPEPRLPSVLYPHTIAGVIAALGEPVLAADYYLRIFANNPPSAARYWSYPSNDPFRCRPELQRKVAEWDMVDERSVRICGTGAPATANAKDGT